MGVTLEWEQETTKTTEYTLTFETSQDEDAVAFFSIPTENYVHKIYTPDGQGGYNEELDIISNSFTPCFQVLNLDYYESIQGNYSELPQIAGVALTSVPGDPSSYPSSASGYNVIDQWNDDPAGVSFGNGAITQEITVTEEKTESYNMCAFLDATIGGGASFQSDITQQNVDMTGGGMFSLNPSGGWADINMTGTTISGTVTNMPLEFRDYGYYFSWKLFSYNYEFEDGTSIPMVSYLVNDISAPPSLPEDFQQDFDRSTSSKNVLTWTYPDSFSSFNIYKYYDLSQRGAGCDIDAPDSITYGDGTEIFFRNVSKAGGVTSTEGVAAGSYSLLSADALDYRAIGRASAIADGEAVVAGRSYVCTLEGLSRYFTASRSGTVHFEDNYAVYTDRTEGNGAYLSFPNDAPGRYLLADNTPAGNYALKMTNAAGGAVVYARLTVNPRPARLRARRA